MWEERLQELLAFRRANGHLNVPRRWPNNRPLAHWVVNQRRLIRTGKLSDARLRMLQELDIRWPSAADLVRARDREWDRMVEVLAEFRRVHGHVDIPAGWSGHPKLGRWVVTQRHLLRSGALREDRRRRLAEVGLEAGREPGRSRARDAAWDRMLEALAGFRRVHGHCGVPKNWPANPKLARWVVRQRHDLKTHAVPPDRRTRLEELGVHRIERRAAATPRVPGPRERAWRARYDELVAFKNRHGHCDVPRRESALGRWASEQRSRHRSGRLGDEQVRLLSGLGFRWDASRVPSLSAR